MGKVKFIRCSESAYNALQTKDEDALYITKDGKKSIYLGDIQVGSSADIIAGDNIQITETAQGKTISVPAASSSRSGVMSASDKVKLAGIQEGADVSFLDNINKIGFGPGDSNIKYVQFVYTDPDTGEQESATTIASGAIGHANGVAGLDSSGKLSSSQLPSTTGTITQVKTTVGTHSTIDVSSGAATFNVPTKTSHLTNDSNYITGVGSSGSIAKFTGTGTLAPGPTIGNDTTKFLTNAGTWATPSSGSTVSISRNVHTTTSSSQDTFALPASSPYLLVVVIVSGLVLSPNEYSVSGSNAVLTTPITHSGTEVQCITFKG